MPISSDQRNKIEALLKKKIDNKLLRYVRESTSMPFLSRLIQDNEKVAAYSFIHSISTTLGMSIYEDVSKIIAKDSSSVCFTKYDVGGVISKHQRMVIDEIILDLRNKAKKVDHKVELRKILSASTEGGKAQQDGKIADFYMVRSNVEHFFEIKTVKPNIDVFTKTKVKLLEWIARRRCEIKVFLAFPYNPYHPKPYARFAEQGVMERGVDFLVGDEYWDFLGGTGTYNDLLLLFDEVGKLYRNKIKEKIIQVAREKIG